MANDRNQTDEQSSGPGEERQGEFSRDEQLRSGVGDEIRGTAEESDEEVEDMEDSEESDEDSDTSF